MSIGKSIIGCAFNDSDYEILSEILLISPNPKSIQFERMKN